MWTWLRLVPNKQVHPWNCLPAANSPSAPHERCVKRDQHQTETGFPTCLSVSALYRLASMRHRANVPEGKSAALRRRIFPWENKGRRIGKRHRGGEKKTCLGSLGSMKRIQTQGRRPQKPWIWRLETKRDKRRLSSVACLCVIRLQRWACKAGGTRGPRWNQARAAV